MGLLLTDTAKPNAKGSTKKGGGEKSDGILSDVGEGKADTGEDLSHAAPPLPRPPPALG